MAAMMNDRIATVNLFCVEYCAREVCMCGWVCIAYRLWLTPSDGGKPETLNCYDFEPIGTNDLRSLVAKVNRKLSRNQFKGLHRFCYRYRYPSLCRTE